MKPFVFVLLIGLACGSAANSQSAFPGRSSFTEETVANMSIIQLRTWTAACVAMKINCVRFPPPRVAYGLLPAQAGYHRPGSDVVLIDIRLLGQPIAIVVMFHEMIHYLQVKRNPLQTGPLSAAERCADEKEAYDLALKFSRALDIATDDDRVHTWDEVAKTYGCLQEFVR